MATGCSFDDPKSLNSDILGKWRWMESNGGIAGMTIKADENNQRFISFEKNGTFTLSDKQTVLIQTTYEVKKGKSIMASDLIPMIYFDGESLMPQSFTLKKDTLFLSDEIYDGYGHTYVRIN